VSSMKGIGFLILCLGLVVTFLGMEASPCIIWVCRVVVLYACGGVMAPDGVSVFNVTYLSGYLGMNLLNCSFYNRYFDTPPPCAPFPHVGCANF
jgi:hypothetical protein